MKILVLQDFLRSGGTERQSILLANAFASAGHSSTLLTFRPGGALAPTISNAVARRTLQPIDLGLDWFAPGLSSMVRTLSPDVTLCMGRMANCYAGTIDREVATTTVIGTMRTGKKLPAAFIRSLETVPHIVANSCDARATLIARYRIPGEKISVIHNALVFPAAANLTETSASRAAVRQQFGANSSTAVLLSVAMFRPEKNQRELIETVAALPAVLDWQLWLAGDGPTRGACEQLVVERKLGSRVKFVGFRKDPSPLYQAADIAVHASESEALSNFLIEAQAHGLPVVAFQAQGIEECFVPGETGWAIARGDAQGFRAAILRLTNPASASREILSVTASRYARDTFDADRQVHAYLELFQRLRSGSKK